MIMFLLICARVSRACISKANVKFTLQFVKKNLFVLKNILYLH